MPNLFTLFKQRRTNDLGGLVKNTVNGVIVHPNLVGPFQCITLRLFSGYSPVIHDDEVEMNFRSVTFYRFQMLARAVVIGFAGLSHQVTDKNSRRPTFANRA